MGVRIFVVAVCVCVFSCAKKNEVRIAPTLTDTSTESRADPKTYPCENNSCQLHGETGRYHMCLSQAEGRCFHFGRICEPESMCLFDPISKRTKECTQFAAGRCERFGADCRP